MSTAARTAWEAAASLRIQKNTGEAAWMADLEAGALADRQAALYGESGAAWQSPEDAVDEAEEPDVHTGDIFG